MPFFSWRKHRNEPGAIECKPSSCTFQAVPQLEEYKISIVVRNQLGEETASNSFNITDRGQRSCRPVWLGKSICFFHTSLFAFVALMTWETCTNSFIMLFVLVLSVSPVVEWHKVSSGVTNVTLSWIIKGKLTHQNLLCQIETDQPNMSEVTVIQGVLWTDTFHRNENGTF